MAGSQADESKGSRGGFHSFMDDLKDKLNDTKLHDAKIALHHKKFVSIRSNACFGLGTTNKLSPGTKSANWAIW
jgi:hypothetical protein